MGDYNEDFAKFIMSMGKQYKDRYGEWCFDVEAFMDGEGDDSEDHFDEDLFTL